MKILNLPIWLLATAALLQSTVGVAADSNEMLARYQRAESLEHAMILETLVQNALVYPNWIGDSNQFWYQRTTKNGKEYRLVDAGAARNRAAFDHSALAGLLSTATGKTIGAKKLPITLLNMELSPKRVTFVAFGKHWRYDETQQTCEETSAPPANALMSPDGKKAVFVRDHNIWLRDITTGREHALTKDGETHNAYGVLPERTSLAGGFFTPPAEMAPEGIWSPDSTYFFTMQTDERNVLSLPVTLYVPADGTVRPQFAQRKYGLPGDAHIAEYSMVIINTESGERVAANYPNVPDAIMWAGPFSGNRAWWSVDGSRAYFVDVSRHLKSARVIEFDSLSGATRVLFTEQSDSYLELGFDFESVASLLPIPETEELIWWSERSGQAHIYLYDLKTGGLKNAITSGDWRVREVLYFDSARREVFVQLAGRVKGRDPYYREVARVNVDTGKVTVLASSDDDYMTYKPGTLAVYVGASLGDISKATTASAAVSPSGDYFVATRTRVDRAPVTELWNRVGKMIMTVEVADVSGLPKGWQWPQPVKTTSADGNTDIYGVVFRPTDFDPNKKYPVIDIAFTNPFYAAVPKGAFGNDNLLGYYYLPAAAWAELGFVVVMMDGRGSVYRSKAFHDHSYGQVQKGSDLADHVAGIEQLAKRYPYMDLNRVGVVDFGGSFGPIYGLLNFPDFYKVGAVTSIWDPRLVMQGDIYQGPNSNFAQSASGHLANNFKGKLLLVQGMLDNFFQPAGVFQVVDAFVRANKDIDLALLPNGGHAWNTNHYGTRRMWDYMVRHLKGSEPPADFRLSNGSEILFTPQ